MFLRSKLGSSQVRNPFLRILSSGRFQSKHVFSSGRRQQIRFVSNSRPNNIMPVVKCRPLSYCYFRGIHNKMTRLYSVQPKINSVKNMMKSRKTTLKDLGVHSELIQLLNARLSQLKGSSDEFHILRTAHHEGSFEDRWPLSSRGALLQHPSIIERFAEAVPPNNMTPAFVEKLMVSQIQVSNQQSWLNDVESFSAQMKRASTKENVDLSLDVQLAPGFGKTDAHPFQEEQAPVLPLSEAQIKKQTQIEADDCQADQHYEACLDHDHELMTEGAEDFGFLSEFEATEMVGHEDASFHVGGNEKAQVVPSLNKNKKSLTKKQTNAKKKKELHQKVKKDTAKMNVFFNNDLESYVQTCIFIGMLDKAISTVKFYSYINQQTADAATYRINNIVIYTSLMHAVAKKGRFGPLRELFQQMTNNGLKPTLQCYAACLECLARQDVMDIELGQHIISDLRRDGFREDNIFNECVFRRDERQYVFKALRTLNPQFEPKYIDVKTGYSGPLLEKLNHPLPPEQMLEVNPYNGIVDNDFLLKQMMKQIRREKEDHLSIESIVKQNTEKPHKNLMTEALLENWKKLLLAGFKRKLSFYETRKKLGDNRMSLYPYMKIFPPDVYVNIMLEEATKLATESETFSPSLGYLCQRMGNRVFNKYLIEDKLDSLIAKKMNRLYRDYIELYNDPNLDMLNHRVLWERLQAKHADGPTLDVPNKTWPIHVIKGVGRILFDIVLYDLKIENTNAKGHNHQLIPAFYTLYRNYSYVTKEEVKPHPKTMKLFQSTMNSKVTFDAIALPMLIPPVPWISVNVGSNLLAFTKLIRLPDAMNKSNNNNTIMTSGNLNAVFDGLNTLSACPWIINKPVLDLIISIFNNKGNKDLDIPPPATECPPLPKLTNDMNSHQRSRVQRIRMKLKQQKSEMHSLWCNELYKLSIANHFRDDIFWFPHNMDFRGRTYPCPPHFNHLGGDVTRSILLFAKGKKLGPQGLDWLKIHLINLTGFKKRSSNAERLAFANENMDNILDSADNPMEGCGWWQTSDEPWQTLACCMEIAKAVRTEDPAEYISHFPVHQDGSCNGLQHYAALGRDKAGAESVNLSPSDQPQDVYSDVCELVERERSKDAENGILVAQKLEGFIKRKVIKQTVMTTVYGVTRYGAKYQILKQLKDLNDFDADYVWQASIYLTDKTFFCLAEMFTATRDIQMWLTFCAHHISHVSLSPVEWVTPLGLSVIQPYHKQSTSQRWGVSYINSMSTLEKPNAMKQKNAFPPNFIHSLDSSHMFLTALYCLREGMTYVSVHDCFWTHPSSVEIMNKICREQFVALHSQPILEDLSKHLLEKFSPTPTGSNVLEDVSQQTLKSVLANVPSKGKFDLKKILKSTYFFS